MEAVSYSNSAKQAKRIKRFIENPDSNSGVLTQPKVIEAGETVTIKSGRQAILANTVINGDLVIEDGGDVFVPAGANFSDLGQRIDTIASEIDAFRTDLADPDTGASMVGFKQGVVAQRGTIENEINKIHRISERPPIHMNEVFPASSHSFNSFTDYIDSKGNELYRYSPIIAKDASGIYHMVYSRGLIHGYGGFIEPNEVNPMGEIVYTRSRDMLNWEDEQVICTALPADVGINPFRSVFGCVIGITPSGRIAVVVNDIPPPSQQWGRPTGNTKYRLFINDNGGALGSWVDKGVFYEHTGDYARIYCSSIKAIPKSGGGFRMAFSDYYSVPSNGVAVGMFYSDDEFETLPVRGANIRNSGGANETDFVFIDSRVGVAVSRASLSMSLTLNGGQSWVTIGSSANFDRSIGSDFIAPTLGVAWKDGDPYLVLGWSARNVNPKMIRWSVASLKDIMKFRDEVIAGRSYTPWTTYSQSGSPFNGAAGYASPIMFEDGSGTYVDVTETTTDPISGFMRAQLRIVRFSVGSLIPKEFGVMIGSKVSRLSTYQQDEVDWNPTFEGATSVGQATYISRTKYSTRIGNICFFNFQMSASNFETVEGQIRFGGLPYTHINSQPNTLFNVEITSPIKSAISSGYDIVALGLQNTQYIYLYKRDRISGALVALTVSDLDSAAFSVYVSGFYKCRY